ncbi:MAG TPA: sigma factor [Armatimonadota bacterium]|nr:sigma factor [Armatimonadota bacterium]
MDDRKRRALVDVIVDRYLPRCAVARRDLMRVGLDGLQRAEEKFDPASGTDFAEYSLWWVKQAITREIAEHRSDPLKPFEPQYPTSDN